MTIGITGASGQLGRLVLEQLKGRVAHDSIVALVRNPEKISDTGVEARTFDYSEPSQLAGSLAGIDTLLLISSSEIGQRAEQHKNVIDAAVTAGIGRIVYTSILRADTTDNPLAEEHKITEGMLLDSGITFTILRNGWYTENYAQSIPAALQHGAVIGSAADGKISAASRLDYAEAAAVALTGSDHDGAVYELAGDTAFTMHDFAEELGRQTGKTIPYVNMPEADYASALIGAGLPEAFAGLLARVDMTIVGGSLFEDRKQLSNLIGRPTKPVSEMITAALG